MLHLGSLAVYEPIGQLHGYANPKDSGVICSKELVSKNKWALGDWVRWRKVQTCMERLRQLSV